MSSRILSDNEISKLSLNNYPTDNIEFQNNRLNEIMSNQQKIPIKIKGKLQTSEKNKKPPDFKLQARQDMTVHRFTQYDSSLNINGKLIGKKGILLFHNVGSGKTITSLVSAMNMFSYGKSMFKEEDKGKKIGIINGSVTYLHEGESGPKYKSSIPVSYDTKWCFNTSFKDLYIKFLTKIKENKEKEITKIQNLIKDISRTSRAFKNKNDEIKKIKIYIQELDKKINYKYPVNDECILKCKGKTRKFNYNQNTKKCDEDKYYQETISINEEVNDFKSKNPDRILENKSLQLNGEFNLLIKSYKSEDKQFLDCLNLLEQNATIVNVNEDIVTLDNGLVFLNPEEEREVTIVTPTGIFSNFKKDLEDIPGYYISNNEKSKEYLQYKKILSNTVTDAFIVYRKFDKEFRDLNSSTTGRKIVVKNILYKNLNKNQEKDVLDTFKSSFNNQIVIFDEVHRLFRLNKMTNLPYLNGYIDYRLLENCKRFIAMTGTPINNSVKDFITMLDFIQTSGQNLDNLSNEKRIFSNPDNFIPGAFSRAPYINYIMANTAFWFVRSAGNLDDLTFNLFSSIASAPSNWYSSFLKNVKDYQRTFGILGKTTWWKHFTSYFSSYTTQTTNENQKQLMDVLKQESEKLDMKGIDKDYIDWGNHDSFVTAQEEIQSARKSDPTSYKLTPTGKAIASTATAATAVAVAYGTGALGGKKKTHKNKNMNKKTVKKRNTIFGGSKETENIKNCIKECKIQFGDTEKSTGERWVNYWATRWGLFEPIDTEQVAIEAKPYVSIIDQDQNKIEERNYTWTPVWKHSKRNEQGEGICDYEKTGKELCRLGGKKTKKNRLVSHKKTINKKGGERCENTLQIGEEECRKETQVYNKPKCREIIKTSEGNNRFYPGYDFTNLDLISNPLANKKITKEKTEECRYPKCEEIEMYTQYTLYQQEIYSQVWNDWKSVLPTQLGAILKPSLDPRNPSDRIIGNYSNDLKKYESTISFNISVPMYPKYRVKEWGGNFVNQNEIKEKIFACPKFNNLLLNLLYMKTGSMFTKSGLTQSQPHNTTPPTYRYPPTHNGYLYPASKIDNYSDKNIKIYKDVLEWEIGNWVQIQNDPEKGSIPTPEIDEEEKKRIYKSLLQNRFQNIPITKLELRNNIGAILENKGKIGRIMKKKYLPEQGKIVYDIRLEEDVILLNVQKNQIQACKMRTKRNYEIIDAEIINLRNEIENIQQNNKINDITLNEEEKQKIISIKEEQINEIEKKKDNEENYYIDSYNEYHDYDIPIEKKHVDAISFEEASHYYLPVVYSASDKSGSNLFAAYLESLGLKYILLHSEFDGTLLKREMDRGIKKSYPLFKNEQLAKFSSKIASSIIDATAETSLNPNDYQEIIDISKESPICVIVHPDMTEGIDLKFNPAIFLMEPPNSYGDYEQLKGRVLRTYSRPYTSCPLKAVYIMISYNKKELKEIYDKRFIRRVGVSQGIEDIKENKFFNEDQQSSTQQVQDQLFNVAKQYQIQGLAGISTDFENKTGIKESISLLSRLKTGEKGEIKRGLKQLIDYRSYFGSARGGKIGDYPKDLLELREKIMKLREPLLTRWFSWKNSSNWATEDGINTLQRELEELQNKWERIQKTNGYIFAESDLNLLNYLNEYKLQMYKMNEQYSKFQESFGKEINLDKYRDTYGANPERTEELQKAIKSINLGFKTEGSPDIKKYKALAEEEYLFNKIKKSLLKEDLLDIQQIKEEIENTGYNPNLIKAIDWCDPLSKNIEETCSNINYSVEQALKDANLEEDAQIDSKDYQDSLKKLVNSNISEEDYCENFTQFQEKKSQIIGKKNITLDQLSSEGDIESQLKSLKSQLRDLNFEYSGATEEQINTRASLILKLSENNLKKYQEEYNKYYVSWIPGAKELYQNIQRVEKDIEIIKVAENNLEGKELEKPNEVIIKDNINQSSLIKESLKDSKGVEVKTRKLPKIFLVNIDEPYDMDTQVYYQGLITSDSNPDGIWINKNNYIIVDHFYKKTPEQKMEEINNFYKGEVWEGYKPKKIQQRLKKEGLLSSGDNLTVIEIEEFKNKNETEDTVVEEDEEYDLARLIKGNRGGKRSNKIKNTKNNKKKNIYKKSKKFIKRKYTKKNKK